MAPLIQDTEFCFPVTVLFNSVGCCKEKRANGEWCQPTNSGGECKGPVTYDLCTFFNPFFFVGKMCSQGLQGDTYPR